MCFYKLYRSRSELNQLIAPNSMQKAEYFKQVYIYKNNFYECCCYPGDDMDCNVDGSIDNDITVLGNVISLFDAENILLCGNDGI